ncbi:hypothetical protein [Streptomyces sp. TRM49041]|uniref:hypothetical protein n=1 Tax=Streptomyces sp. TRM49041 TaxID=2603216 RepID=UPI0011F0954A|nr:hypothetical protein [Streptomyces sp. TRM49041]
MDLEKHPPPAPDGCLVAAVRIPVRIVVVAVVVPVRMVWDVLALCARTFDRTVLRPLGRALFVIPLTWLWHRVLAPLGYGVAWLAAALVTYGLVRPGGWLWRRVLVPLGRGLAWLVAYGVVVPARWLWRWVLVPLGAVVVWPARVLGAVVVWLVGALVVAPAGALYRWVLTPLGRALVVVGREVADAFGVAWRVAGYVSRAFGRAVKWLARQLVGRPAAWFYREVCTPVGHRLRDGLWLPARDAARGALTAARETLHRARRDAWRALVGGEAGVRPVGEGSVPARTLGSTTTVPGAAPAPEVSPHQRG